MVSLLWALTFGLKWYIILKFFTLLFYFFTFATLEFPKGNKFKIFGNKFRPFYPLPLFCSLYLWDMRVALCLLSLWWFLVLWSRVPNSYMTREDFIGFAEKFREDLKTPYRPWHEYQDKDKIRYAPKKSRFRRMLSDFYLDWTEFDVFINRELAAISELLWYLGIDKDLTYGPTKFKDQIVVDKLYEEILELLKTSLIRITPLKWTKEFEDWYWDVLHPMIVEDLKKNKYQTSDEKWKWDDDNYDPMRYRRVYWDEEHENYMDQLADRFYPDVELVALIFKMKFSKYKPSQYEKMMRTIKLQGFFNFAYINEKKPHNSWTYIKQRYLDGIMPHITIYYNFIKTTIIAILCALIYFFYSVFFFKVPFLKQLAIWFIVGMMFFWLISGFNFFLKRYQYGKFTSQIKRFWKRTNACFWLIEGFLMLLFFYYYLNSSQEPAYMFDYSSLNQEYLISLRVAGLNIILLAIVIYFMYFVLLRLNSNNWYQINVYVMLISIFIFYSFFLETYQFYYVLTGFNERFWVLDEETNRWNLESDNPILRTKHQYFLVCLIAKYWHFLFIFLSWVFFIIKSFERRKVTITLFAANLQNIIILYVLNIVCYIQWLKWFYRRFFDNPYNWFFTNVDNKIVFTFMDELILFVKNICSINLSITSYGTIIYKSLSLWNSDSLAIWKFV